MRQFGSSINYVGHSAFLATVSSGTQLYHGASHEDSITGMNWLAFEPEHAMLFAKPDDAAPIAQTQSWGPDATFPYGTSEMRIIEDHFGDTTPEASLWGYLQTYVTLRPLRLLYLDGMSAAKSNNGTLDFQDKVILQGRFNFTSDDQRATELCRIAREDWSIDGFIRMEMGFEVILCSVAGAVRHADSISTKAKDAFACYKALAQRFHGIGHTVTVDYDNFVTRYGRADQDGLPELYELIASRPDGSSQINWQGVTDKIVGRYSAALRFMTSLQSKTDFNEEANRLLLPFIDHRRRNPEADIARCASHAIPQHGQKAMGLAEGAIYQVSRLICTELLEALKDERIDQAVGRIRNLMAYLDWSTWKACLPDCKDDEVCYVPVWPFSRRLQKTSSKCLNEAGFFKMVVDDLLTI